MLLKKLITNCPIHLRNIKISDLTSDSREVKKNSLFFAVKGKNYDGFNFVNEAIKKGILALSLDNLGLRIERSVTTYMTDDNPIFSEVSANESINTSVRTLRARLASQIGNPVVSGSKAQIESAVKVSLSKQVKDAVIKAFQNVVVTDLGDRFDISYEVAAVEPLNFIKITANVVRIPG